MTLQRIRERLVLILLALLPLHALAVTVLTKLIAGPGHAPLGYLAFWKEAALLVILGLALAEWVKEKGYRRIRLDPIDLLVLFFTAVALVVTTWSGIPSRGAFLLGLKYDLFPLLLFFILRRVDWSDWFGDMLIKTLTCAGIAVAAYGILGFFLPDAFFAALGYSDLHSLYVPDGPLAPFQQIGGSAIHRIQSTMSGPNQLGIWLLLPLSVVAVAAYRKRNLANLGTLLLLLIAIVMTFSRAAWIGAFVVIATLVFLGQSRITRRRMFFWVMPVVLVSVVLVASVFPSVILRSASTRGHLDKPMAGIVEMIDHPFGTGLGTAGPATNRVSDACVELQKGSDATWAQAHPDLCVFVGGTQVQPVGKECDCPFITENWYIQIGVEAGIIGFLLYLALFFLILRRLIRIPGPSHAALAFLGICICGLFLHAFEDSAVAYTAFVLAAVALHMQKARISER